MFLTNNQNNFFFCYFSIIFIIIYFLFYYFVYYFSIFLLFSRFDWHFSSCFSTAAREYTTIYLHCVYATSKRAAN